MTNPARPTLTDLLDRWHAWSHRELLTSSLARAAADGDPDRELVLRQALEREPIVPALDALAANHELSSLLQGWQWHAIRAAREADATWPQIANALDTTAENARAGYLRKIENAERHVPDLTDTAPYLAVLDDPPQAHPGRPAPESSMDERPARPATARPTAPARRSRR